MEEKKTKIKALVLDNIAQKIKEEEYLALSRTERKKIEKQKENAQKITKMVEYELNCRVDEYKIDHPQIIE